MVLIPWEVGPWRWARRGQTVRAEGLVKGMAMEGGWP